MRWTISDTAPVGGLGFEGDDVRSRHAGAEAMMARQSAESCEHTTSAADFLPPRITLPQLREAAASCKGCGIYCNATQTVFGQGATHAAAMFVGEQPGDQ